VTRFRQRPNTNSYNNAITHELLQYSAINNLTDMKMCLALGYPFVLGFSVYESFETDTVSKTGIIPLPQLNEQCLLARIVGD
jgi:hypothetical protein